MQRGDRLGDWVLRDKLGEGGFGEVWEAAEVDRPWNLAAIKVPRGRDGAAALRREGRLQTAVEHPNIVRNISIDFAHDPPFLVSEYVPGESLRGRLKREGRLAPEEAVRILGEVLEALEAVHDAGLVHRDLKPENVLLGKGGVVKVSDFGLGKVASDAAASIALSHGPSLSEGGGVVGTYHYMSPEQMKGASVDARTDLYACGVMLYEMLTGEAHPVRLPVPGATPALSDVVDRALAADPQHRYQSAVHMRRYLEGGIGGLRVPWRWRDPGSRGVQVWSVVGFLALYAVIGVLLLALWRTREMRRDREEAVARFVDASEAPSLAEAERRYKSGDVDGALDAYESIVLAGGTSTDVWIGRAWVYWMKALQVAGRGEDPRLWLKKGIVDLDGVLLVRPQDASSLTLRGDFHKTLAYHEEKLGGEPRASYEAAIADYERALALDPLKAEWAGGGLDVARKALKRLK